MANNTEKVIIDSASGNIIDEHSKDNVILVGVHPSTDSAYTDNIQLILNPKSDSPISIDVNYGGYNMQLFIGDFTGDNKSEIMVRGGFGGSGGFEIGVIYKYENNTLIEIFNQDKFAKDNSCVAKYVNNYKVHVNCGNKKYSIDLSSRPKQYLNEIYSSDSSVKPYYEPYVDAPSAIYPIKQVYNNFYDLLIQQRIVGIANADTLGIIQTLGSLENTKFEILSKGLLFLSYLDAQDRKNPKKSKTKSNNTLRDKYATSTFPTRNEVFYGKEFNIEKDNLDLIVNSINEDNNTLYIDAYLINLKNNPISQVNNFKMELRDNSGRLLAQKTFDNVDIQGSIRPYEGKRILLTFFKDEYSLFNVDTNNITWNYTYNIR